MKKQTYIEITTDHAVPRNDIVAVGHVPWLCGMYGTKIYVVLLKPEHHRYIFEMDDFLVTTAQNYKRLVSELADTLVRVRDDFFAHPDHIVEVVKNPYWWGCCGPITPYIRIRVGKSSIIPWGYMSVSDADYDQLKMHNGVKDKTT